MLETHISHHGEAAVENMADLLKAFPRYAERAVASALRSEGWRIKNVIQLAIARGGPEGQRWPQLNPHTGIMAKTTKYARKARFEGIQVTGTRLKNYKSVWRGKKGSKRRGVQYWSVSQKLSTRLSPLLKLRGAVRYVYDKSLQLVSVGFVRTSERLLRYVRRQATGYSTPVSARSRKLAFASGFPLKKSTSRLVTPARPLIDPVFSGQRRAIDKNLRQKYINAVVRYVAEGNKRKDP